MKGVNKIYEGGSFGTRLNKHFVRRYDGKLILKKEKWQLIRGMSYEEMKECNKEDELDENKAEDKIVFIKVFKTISKNWKLLIYLKNKNIMKTVIKNGLERGMVWSFRRFKEPIRSKQEEKSKTESEQESLDTPYQENDLETLPQKFFLELDGISKSNDEKN